MTDSALTTPHVGARRRDVPAPTVASAVPRRMTMTPASGSLLGRAGASARPTGEHPIRMTMLRAPTAHGHPTRREGAA